MRKTNLMDVRLQNANTILHELELHEGTTNTEIALTYRFSIPTVTKIVNVLKQNDMVQYLGANQSSGGRRAKRIGLNPDYRNFIGLFISKHIVYLAVIDFTGKVIKNSSVYCQFEDTPSYWESIRQLIEDILQFTTAPCTCGLAVPGICDYEHDQIIRLDSLGISSLSISAVRKHMQCDIWINNSEKISGLAQLYGKEQYTNAVFVTLNRHISGVLILNNEIFTFSSFDCAFGDMIISRESKHVSCGPAGTFNSLCSSSFIIDLLRKEGIEDLYDSFFQALNNGNEHYLQLWNEYLDHLAVGIHNIHAVFGINVVVGGEMANYLPPYFEELCCRIDRLSALVPAKDYLLFSEYGRFDSAIGAALDARKEYIRTNLPILLQKQEEA
ncbi:MAG: ROK family protein [Lachnospiraceae bacterium]|jgi:predicted NBD/HSP70 family sugar kinase|nr:ROK family protein [Lachnospiraceae bacterium]MCI9601312.1 ROK family protein [Lachnospiraceae bacterium]